MHLLFDAKTHAFHGEVFEHGGAISRIQLEASAPQALSLLVHGWHQQGIRVFRSVTRVAHAIKTTQFFYEDVLLSDVHAFQALNASASSFGLTVCSLDDAYEPYWRELLHWPISPMSKVNLVFLMKSLPSQAFSDWSLEWKDLQADMLAV